MNPDTAVPGRTPQGFSAGLEGRGWKPWVLLVLITASFTYTFLCRYIWSPIQAYAMTDLGLSLTRGSMYISLYFAGYILAQLPGGFVADHFSPRVILVSSTLIGALSTFFVGLTDSFFLGLVLRGIAGVVGGFTMAACVKVIALQFEPRRQSTAVGILMAAPPLGIALANLLGPRLNHVLGWKGTLMAAGLAGCGLGLLLLFVPKEHGEGSAGEKSPSDGLFTGFAQFFKNPRQVLFAGGGFFYMFVIAGCATAAGRYFVDLGFSDIRSGVILTAYSLAGILGSCGAGWLADKLGMDHRRFLVVFLGIMSLLTMGFSAAGGYGALIAIGVLYGAVSFMPGTHFTTLAMKTAGVKYAATAAVCLNFFMQSASMVQPVVTSLISERSAAGAMPGFVSLWGVLILFNIISVFFCVAGTVSAGTAAAGTAAGGDGGTGKAGRG